MLNQTVNLKSLKVWEVARSLALAGVMTFGTSTGSETAAKNSDTQDIKTAFSNSTSPHALLHRAGSPAAHKPHWDYTGDDGPDHWSRLSEEYAVCSFGSHQSPVNLSTHDHPTASKPLGIHYSAAPLSVHNNGHTIQIDYPGGSSLEVDGHKYDLVQFHFHTPSEHTIDGKKFPMELHFVHKDREGKLGVIGVMIAEGKENAMAASIWKHMPSTAGKRWSDAGTTIDASSLLPRETAHYRLEGSLTTPPCTEGVSWHILKTPIQFSKEQINTFRKLFPMNARPLQKQNDHPILTHK